MFIFYLPFIYYGAIYESPNKNIRTELLLYILGATSIPLIYFILGKDTFRKKSVWKEEGYSGFYDWFKNSKSYSAKLFRVSNIAASIVRCL